MIVDLPIDLAAAAECAKAAKRAAIKADTNYEVFRGGSGGDKLRDLGRMYDAHKSAYRAAEAAGIPKGSRLQMEVNPGRSGPEFTGLADQGVTMSGGKLHRIGDADECGFVPVDETKSIQFQNRVEETFMRVCSDETGATETPEETEKREKREARLKAQTAKVAGGLVAAGKSAYRADGWKLAAYDVHERTLDEIPAWRRICLLPYVAHRLRLPYLNWLEFFLQSNPYARFWTFTSGERCRVEQLRKRIKKLTRKLSALNAQKFMKDAGVEIVFRSVEIGTPEKTNRKRKPNPEEAAAEMAGLLESDAGGMWYHPHAHCVVTMERQLERKEWNRVLKNVWKFWGNNWDEGKRIQDVRECVKYIVKPGHIVALAENNPAELGRLHDALFRVKLVQPLGELRNQMRAAKGKLVPQLCWRDNKRKWALQVNPNKNFAAGGADKSGIHAADGSEMSVSAAEKHFVRNQYGLGPVGEIPVCHVVARCSPAFNRRGVKSPRVIVRFAPCMGTADVIANAAEHPLVRRLVASTRDSYNAGLAIAKAERGELALTGGTRGGVRLPAPAIRVHTGTPTVLELACLAGLDPGPEESWREPADIEPVWAT